MKTGITLILFAGVFLLLLLEVNPDLYSNSSGAPAQVSGAPADNSNTCGKSGCHTVGAVMVTPGIITSDIPASGYVSGNTYTITASVAQTGISRWGFQISPQSLTGTLLGQPVITDPIATKIISFKYITHKSAGITGVNGRSWSFNWIAPQAGTGTVVFYGAFNFANGNGSRTGDAIHTSQLTVNEFVSSVYDAEENSVNLNIYPNPAIASTEISVYLKETEAVTLTLYDMKGNIVKQLCSDKSVIGSFICNMDVSELSKGIYTILLVTGSQSTARRIVVL